MTGQAGEAGARLLVLVGTKAQFIKTAPILKVLDARAVPYRLAYTGQHSETFSELEAAFGTRAADDNLVPGVEASTHSGLLGWTWRFWRAALARIRAGAWRGVALGVVHGDTASTLFSALALRLAGARVAHVEAGLRSPRLLEPFPEELVRRAVSRLSALHLAPDAQAVANLRGVDGKVVDTGGNTLQDALATSLRALGTLPAQGGGGGHALVSIHRSENLSRRAVLDMLMEEVARLAGRMPVKFVLHPATRERLGATGWIDRLQRVPGLELMARMDHPAFVRLLIGSRFLLTDGGSNQEEAAILGVPTLLLRRATERNDGVGGNVELSGLDRAAIRRFCDAHVEARWTVRSPGGPSPSGRVVDALCDALAADGRRQ